MKKKKFKNIEGMILILIRVVIMLCLMISVKGAFNYGGAAGVLAGSILILAIAGDVLYLAVVLISAYARKEDKDAMLRRDIDEMLEDETSAIEELIEKKK